MSGFEIAGIVLAVLPLFIEAAKEYSETAHKATSRSASDEKLQEFYEQFWWETFELRKQIEKIVHDLPGLSEDRKTNILKADDVEHWSKAADVAQALSDYFVSQDDYMVFQTVMGKVLDLLSRVVEDNTVRISRAEKNHGKMYQALEKFQKDRLAGITHSSFSQRFKFWRKEKDRTTCLKNLKTWNKRVAIVVEAACKATERRKAVSAPSKGPSSRLRTLSRRLFTALSMCWSCDCESRHEARFSLANCIHPNKDSVQGEMHFDFLIAHPQCQTKWKWRECTVLIKAPSLTDSQNRARLGRICDVGPDVQTGYSLQLLIEDLESSQRIWQLNWQRAQLRHHETKPATTFQMMLQSCNTPSLIERRRLALVFAHSLFQLHESPWLSQQWAKDRIHFFYNSTGILDLHRPYLGTSFDDFPSNKEPIDLNRFHRNLGILRLGILLIEVHRWKPLESFLVDDDLYNGQPTPNTDMEVAWRVQETLDDCFPTYRDAIKACLEVPWVSGGLRVSLEDPETWNGVYTNVIQPLEREVALGAAVL
ncbi:hypothetical protein B0J13DRAFT_503233 [Dactylonectria estremocensis]|uniref:DUF7580 domain-containing protein n=1 Tax=Dactylonectria estremocensis TaxID=1079267 RepID=A0A9P9J5B6_9HYPO|nr:hypothetical protein B0J13DRAFT_503233 [Dactylonectria estremocensis]